MSLVRVQFFSISLDGFGTGDGQSHKAPFGHAGGKLHQWQFATQWWREMAGQPGGSSGIDNAFVQLHEGATPFSQEHTGDHGAAGDAGSVTLHYCTEAHPSGR